MTTNQTTAKKATFTINEIVKELGLSRVYVHRSITKFKTLKATKVAINNSKTQRWLVSREDLEAWNKTRSLRSHRDDGRSKFVMYATQDELKALLTQLKTSGSKVEIERAYKKKVEAAS